MTQVENAIVFTTEQLRRLCDHAEQLRFSNGPNAKFWTQVDPAGQHVVSHWFEHRPSAHFWDGVQHDWDFSHNNGVNVRAVLLCKMSGTMQPLHLLCDFDWDDFMVYVV